MLGMEVVEKRRGWRAGWRGRRRAGREGGIEEESDEWRERAGRQAGGGEVWMRGKARQGEAEEGLTDATLAAGRWREGSAGFPFRRGGGLEKESPACPRCPIFKLGVLGGEADPIPAPSAAEWRGRSLPPSRRVLSPHSFIHLFIQRSSVGSLSVPSGGHTPSSLIRASRWCRYPGRLLAASVSHPSWPKWAWMVWGEWERFGPLASHCQN